LARQQSQTIDFATSNVKGSPVPVFVAGGQLLEIYPIGPLGGVAFNLTLMSYLGSLDMAINIDTAAVTDPELLKRCLDRSFKALARV
jgi:diacylglycerol O-acyltransferase / wax synthase